MGLSVFRNNANTLQGHTQELNRHFSTLSLIGLASTTTISWTGLGLGLITEIGAGGPGAVIYGFILVTMLQCFLGASLAEFVSSYPTEGGMYHWIAAVAPRRATGILSFLTGWFSVLGCECVPQRVFGRIH
jgi:choline transport protein